MKTKINFENIFDNLFDGVVIYEIVSSKIVYYNSAFAEMFHLSSNQKILQKPFNEFIKTYAFTTPQNTPVLYETAEGEKQRTDIYHMKNKKGTKGIWLLINAQKYQEKKNHYIITTFHDHTSHIEEDKQQDIFINSVSHDLKSLLTSLKAYVQILERQFIKTKNEKASTYLSNMNGQIRKLTQLIADLLDVTRIQTGKFLLKKEKLDFKELLEEITGAMNYSIDKEIQIIKSDTIPQLSIDKDRIVYVLSVLLSYVIQHSSGKKITLSITRNRNHVVCSINSSGLTFTAEEKSALFTLSSKENHSLPLYKRLGLFIAGAIVNHHGGEIKITNGSKDNTIFSFTLPLLS